MGRGAGSSGRGTGGAPCEQSRRRHRARSAARASKRPRPAVGARCARPAMAVGTFSPRPLPLLLLPLLPPLLLHAGPVRAQSKVRAALRPGRCSVGNRREGALWLGVRAKGGGGRPERRTRKGDRTSGLAWKPRGPGSQERSAWGKKRWRW